MQLAHASHALLALAVVLTAAALASASRAPPFFLHWSSAPAAAAAAAPSSGAAVLPQPFETTQSFLLALRLVRRPDSLPLFGCNVLAHARLQRCRPSFPPHPALLPPSLRLPTPATGPTSASSSGSRQQSSPLFYSQLECMSEWAENWALRSNDVGLVPLQLRVPTERLKQLQRLLEDLHPPQTSLASQLVASTRRLHFQLHRQCPALTGTDLLWLDMMDFAPSGNSKKEAATAAVKRKFDPQGLVALLINTPRLPGYRSDLETRQVLWPFDPREGLHELDLFVLSKQLGESDSPSHPFLVEAPSRSRLSLAQQLLQYFRNAPLQHSMLHVAMLLVFFLPLTILSFSPLLYCVYRGAPSFVGAVTGLARYLAAFAQVAQLKAVLIDQTHSCRASAARAVEAFPSSFSSAADTARSVLDALVHNRATEFLLDVMRVLECAWTDSPPPPSPFELVSEPLSPPLSVHSHDSSGSEESSWQPLAGRTVDDDTSSAHLLSSSASSASYIDLRSESSGVLEPEEEEEHSLGEQEDEDEDVEIIDNDSNDEVESEIGLGSPLHPRSEVQRMRGRARDGRQRFGELVQRVLTPDSAESHSSWASSSQANTAAAAERKRAQLRDKPVRALHMGVWKDAEQKREQQAAMRDVAFLVQQSTQRRRRRQDSSESSPSL